MFTVGDLIKIKPQSLMPASALQWYNAPNTIVGVVLDIEGDPAIFPPLAQVYVITELPGLANKKTWIGFQHLECLK